MTDVTHINDIVGFADGDTLYGMCLKHAKALAENFTRGNPTAGPAEIGDYVGAWMVSFIDALGTDRVDAAGIATEEWAWRSYAVLEAIAAGE